MFSFEYKIIDFIKKNMTVILFIVVTLFGLMIRYSGLGTISGDYIMYLSEWWNEISKSGTDALKSQVGNYNIPYQIMILILTYLPLSSLMAYKLLSILFDIVLAVTSALIVYEIDNKNSKLKACFTYGVVFCSLNVIINSSFWAQCDSIYSSFVLLGIYFLIKEKRVLPFVMFGIAFGFKLQTVFILPFLLVYYFTEKKYSIFNFLIIPLIDVIMCLPAILFFRRPFEDIYNIYFQQTDEYTAPQMNFPNIYAIMLDSETGLIFDIKIFSIFLTFVVLTFMFAFMIIKKFDLSKNENFLRVIIWSLWTAVMFLPFMHERYSYLLDVVLILISVIFYRKKYWIFAFVCNIASFRSYCEFVFYYGFIGIEIVAIFYILFYTIFTVQLLKDIFVSDLEIIRST